MVADNSVVASSVFEPLSGKRHERKMSSSAVGRAGQNPMYAHIAKRPETAKARCDLAQKDDEVAKAPAGELNTSVTKTSIFGVYSPEGSGKNKRHERSASFSLVGRAGAQCSGAYTAFRKEHFTREERLRREIKKAVEEDKIQELHKIYCREHTRLPFENNEIAQWRRAVAKSITNRLKSEDPHDLKDGVDLADQQEQRFPYAIEVKRGKWYKDAVDRLKEMSFGEVEAPAESPVRKSPSALRGSSLKAASKKVSFGGTPDDDTRTFADPSPSRTTADINEDDTGDRGFFSDDDDDDDDDGAESGGEIF